MKRNKSFKITKRKLSSIELLNYLYEVLNCPFTLADDFCDTFYNISNEKRRKNINQQNKIKELLAEFSLLPEHIYYYENYEINKIMEKFGEMPTFFTGIAQVSIEDGLVIMEHYCNEIYTLHDNLGNVILPYCKDLNIGANGLISYCLIDDWGEIKYAKVVNGKLTDYDGEEIFDYENNLFPYIFDRDSIPQMNDWIKPKYLPSHLDNITDKKLIRKILKEDGKLIRYMPQWVRESEEFGLIACTQIELAFTLISEKLQNNRSFVVKLFANPDVNEFIKRYFNTTLKNDSKIISLETEKLERTKQKRIKNDVAKEDGLPF